MSVVYMVLFPWHLSLLGGCSRRGCRPHLSAKCLQGISKLSSLASDGDVFFPFLGWGQRMDMIMTYTEASLGLNLIMNCLKEKGIVLNKKINSSLKRLVILTFYKERLQDPWQRLGFVYVTHCPSGQIGWYSNWKECSDFSRWNSYNNFVFLLL